MSQKYAVRFYHHVKTFMIRHDLLPSSGKALLAVSGGADSMALFHFFFQLLANNIIKQIEVIHVNHGTRAENEAEEAFVAGACKRLGVKCHIVRLQLTCNLLNFEASARHQRYQHLKAFLKFGDRLYTAHHIDDSFEWKLMQQFKSSQKILGIPLINGQVVRPFNSVTKNQIEKYLRHCSLGFCHDSSNDSIHYERNFIRLKIIPEIRKRFPKYLKHYVFWANKEARAMGVHCLVKQENFYQVTRDLFGAVTISRETGVGSFLGASNIIYTEIIRLSKNKRGVLAKQIEKLIEMAGSGLKGPLLFSGEVLGFASMDSIYLISKEQLKWRQRVDLLTGDLFGQAIASHIPQGRLKKEMLLGRSIFPHYVFFKQGRYPSLKKSFSLMEHTCKRASALGFGFNTLDKIIRLSKKRDILSNEFRMVTQSELLDHLK